MESMNASSGESPRAPAKLVWLVAALVAVLAAGAAWYYWPEFFGASLGGRSVPENTGAAAGAGNDDASTASLQTQSSSDDVKSIEADLNASQLDNLDQELKDINSFLNQ